MRWAVVVGSAWVGETQWPWLVLLFFFLFTFRKRGREGEKQRPAASCTPPIQDVSWPGIELVTFWCAGQQSVH